MAISARNTGSHFRFDADEGLWEAKMRLKVITDGIVRFEEFVTKVATVVELLAFIADVLGAVAARPGATVEGAGDLAAIRGSLHALTDA